MKALQLQKKDFKKVKGVFAWTFGVFFKNDGTILSGNLISEVPTDDVMYSLYSEISKCANGGYTASLQINGHSVWRCRDIKQQAFENALSNLNRAIVSLHKVVSTEE